MTLLAADPAELYRQAVDRQRAGDLSGAVELYRECLTQEPSNIQARSNLGAALSGLGRYDEAIAEYNEALKAAPEQVRPYLQRNIGLAFFKSGRITEASDVFTRLHEQDPSSRDMTLLAAECFLQLGDASKAVALLKPLQSAATDDKTLAYVFGMALLRNGDTAEAQRVLDPILKDTSSAEGNFAMGLAMFTAGDFPASIQAFKRAAELNPALSGLYSYYGRALLFTGDPDAAIDAFKKQLASDANDYDANLNLAEIYAIRGQFKDAEPLLRRAVLLRPASKEARAALDDTLAGRFTRRPMGVAAVRPGEPAPKLQLQGAALPLPRAGRPAVLVFGSYSCPNFRSAAPAINSLAAKYASSATFLLVYIGEAHATDQWQSTRNERDRITIAPAANAAEKQANARLCTRKLHLQFPAVVDGMDGAAEKAYQAWPSRVYVIAADGRTRYSSGLTELEFDAKALEAAIREAAATSRR